MDFSDRLRQAVSDRRERAAELTTAEGKFEEARERLIRAVVFYTRADDRVNHIIAEEGR